MQKSPPPLSSSPRRRGRACGVHLGPSSQGVGVPSLFSWGAPAQLHRWSALGHPGCLGKFVGAQPLALPFARWQRGGGDAASQPPHADLAPPAPALPGCTPFSPARTHSRPGMAPPRPLCPRQQGGGRKKGSRVAPDVTGVADERRPPPRPCPSLRAGSGSGAASQAGRAGAPRAPASAFLVAPRSPGGTPQPGMGPGRLGASPGQPRAGTAATPAQAGPKTPGPERAGGGGGDRGRGRWEGAMRGAAPRSARGWHPPRAEPPGPLEPAAVWSWEGPPYQPSPRPGGKTLFPSRPTPPRTDGVRNAEAN